MYIYICKEILDIDIFSCSYKYIRYTYIYIHNHNQFTANSSKTRAKTPPSPYLQQWTSSPAPPAALLMFSCSRFDKKTYDV